VQENHIIKPLHKVLHMVRVEVRGKGDDYHVKTLLAWLSELKEFLEGELRERVEVGFVEVDSKCPLLYVDGELVFEGLPGEEGYLIEIIRSARDARRATA
jgi:hypothetical protein